MIFDLNSSRIRERDEYTLLPLKNIDKKLMKRKGKSYKEFLRAVPSKEIKVEELTPLKVVKLKSMAQKLKLKSKPKHQKLSKCK